MLNIYSQQQPEELVEAEKKEEKPLHSDYRKYQDASGDFNTKDFGYSIWFTSHKLIMYRVLVVVFLILDILLVVVNFTKWGIFLAGFPAQIRLEQELVNFNNISVQGFAPKPLQVLSTELLSGGVDRYDAVSEIVNSNDRFMLTIDYHFNLGTTNTPRQQRVILPGDDTLIAALGSQIDSVSLGSLALVFDNFNWKRISGHKIADLKTWKNDRLQFSTENFVYSSAFGADGLKVNRLQFTLKNNSAFGYKQPSFLVGLYSQDVLVGVMPLQLPDFPSVSSAAVDLRNFVSNLRVDSVKIFPLINIFDQNVYLPVSDK